MFNPGDREFNYSEYSDFSEEVQPQANKFIAKTNTTWYPESTEHYELPFRPRNPMEPQIALAERLRKARKDSGLTLEQVSVAAGISKTYLWELEHDEKGAKRPSADVLLKIAEALKTTIAELLGLPSVQVNKFRVDVSKSLIEFRAWMEEIGQQLTDGEFNDLAAMRFRGGQPRTKDDWFDLYRTLKRTTKR